LIELRPIGQVRSARPQADDDDWDGVPSSIELDPGQFSTDSLLGLDEFSHVEVIFVFDRVDPAEVETGSRRPRGNPDWPEVGIFSQRAKARPNRLGTTVCRLLSVHGLTLDVEGLDAVDGTPVVDVKPYLEEFGPRGELRQPLWSHELMRDYWRAGSP